jgi:hypothetical protein
MVVQRMKTHSWLSLILLLMLSLFSDANWAWGHHGGGIGFYFGAPFYPYYGYGLGYPPYYGYAYAPPVVIAAPSTPQTYIQQVQPAPAIQSSQTAYWHYCRKPEGYYPYVKECPDGWQLVDPTPH